MRPGPMHALAPPGEYGGPMCVEAAMRPLATLPVLFSDKGKIMRTGACFTKYLTTIFRSPYDNVEVKIDLRRTSNLQNILRLS